MVSTPKAPDPYKTADAQGSANREAAQASSIVGNPNETSPYGAVNYTISGYETVVNDKGKKIQVPRYSRAVTLSPEQQKLYNLQTGMQTNLGKLGVEQSAKLRGLLGTSLDTKGLSKWQTYDQAPDLATKFKGGGAIRQDQAPTDRKAVEEAELGRYRTQTATDRAAQDAQLAARGMAPGSQQWGNVETQRGQQDVDAYQQAYLASGAESRANQAAYNEAQNQRFSQNKDRATFGNQFTQQNWANDNAFVDQMNALRGQQLGERQTLRNAPINEISALMSGAQVSVPQFQAYNSPSVGAAPVGQYIYDNYNAKMQQSQAMMSGLFGLGSAAVGAAPYFPSDRRLKRDIEPLTGTLAGLPLYTFYYRDGFGLPEGLKIGVMADEVREVYPEAVTTGIDGYDAVDYGLLNQKEHEHA